MSDQPVEFTDGYERIIPVTMTAVVPMPGRVYIRDNHWIPVVPICVHGQQRCGQRPVNLQQAFFYGGALSDCVGAGQVPARRSRPHRQR